MRFRLVTVAAAAALAAAAAVVPAAIPAQAADAGPAGWHNVYRLGVRGEYLSAITSPASNAVWVVGQSWTSPASFLLHWNGHRWRRGAMPVPGFHAAAIASSSATDVWLFGWTKTTIALHWDGRIWHRLSWPGLVGFGPASISVLGPKNVWIPGATGPEHWNGSTWKAFPAPANCARDQVGASTTAGVWTAPVLTGAPARLVVCHWTGHSWIHALLPYSGTTTFVNLLVSGPNVWITGVQGSHRRLWHLLDGRWHLMADQGNAYHWASLASYRWGGLWADWGIVWTGRRWIGVNAPLLVVRFLQPAALSSVPRSAEAWMVGSDLSGQVVLRVG